MTKVQELSDNDFATSLDNDTTPALVDFSASWCQPCKALAPTIDTVSEEYQGRLRVYKVDIDSAPEAAAKYGIRSVPTCVFVRDGAEVGRFMGNLDLRSVKEHVEKALA